MALLKFRRSRVIFFLCYSLIGLFMHFFAIKEICNCVGVFLKANDVFQESEKAAMKIQAETARHYSENFTHVFLIMCYLFPIIIGILLIIKKIHLIEYIFGLLCFVMVQCGIFILTKFINCYGMTEIHGRLRIVIYQPFTYYALVIPLIIYIILYLFIKIIRTRKNIIK